MHYKRAVVYLDFNDGEDAMDRGRWKKLTYSPGSSQTKGHKTVVVVVLYDLSIQ